MHGCMCVSAYGYEAFRSPFHLAKLKQFYTSFYFLFFKQKRKIPNTEPHFLTNTVPNLAPYCVSRPGLWPPEQCHPFEKGGQVGWGGWTWEGWRVTWVSLRNPSMTSHAPPCQLLLGLFMARWDAVGRGDTVWRRPHPLDSFKWFSQSVKGHGLSLRRCCWRNWMWRPRPCPRCPRRPPTCGCGAWGRGHWPAGAHQCGPLYGTLDSAL